MVRRLIGLAHPQAAGIQWRCMGPRSSSAGALTAISGTLQVSESGDTPPASCNGARQLGHDWQQHRTGIPLYKFAHSVTRCVWRGAYTVQRPPARKRTWSRRCRPPCTLFSLQSIHGCIPFAVRHACNAVASPAACRRQWRCRRRRRRHNTHPAPRPSPLAEKGCLAHKQRGSHGKGPAQQVQAALPHAEATGSSQSARTPGSRGGDTGAAGGSAGGAAAERW